MTRILLLGKIGQLGWELNRTLRPLGEVTAIDFPQIDLTRPELLIPILEGARPEVIVNATAYTAVDKAEEETDLAYAINGQAVERLAAEAKKLGAGLIHFSTDYVFDGQKGSPYVETDSPKPLGVYGASKLLGEQAIQGVGGAHWIFRTSWVYSTRRDSFVTKVLSWSRRQTTLRVVDDQVGNPTWCRMLAEVTAQLLALAGKDVAGWMGERSGLYHLAGDGFASRLEWARAILAADPRSEEQIIQEILPASTSEFPTPARRPLFSALDCSLFAATFGIQLPAWQEALRLAMEIPSS